MSYVTGTQRTYRAILLTIGLALLVSTADASEKNKVDNNLSRGATLWANTCAHCHNMRSPNEFRPDQWRAVMAHMQLRAGLTGKDAKAILSFLTGQSLDADAQSKAQATSIALGEQKDPSRKKTSTLSGAAIYKQTCSVCHGPQGKGGIPGTPDMTVPNGVLSKPYKVLLRNITQGVGNMPARGGNMKLTDKEIHAVLTYMLSTFKRR